MTSGNPPAPRPSSKRPPLSTSSDAAAFAMTAGSRSGRFATAGKNETRSVWESSIGSSAHVSRKWRWYGWSWMPTRSKPASSAAVTIARLRSSVSTAGTIEMPNRRASPAGTGTTLQRPVRQIVGIFAVVAQDIGGAALRGNDPVGLALRLFQRCVGRAFEGEGRPVRDNERAGAGHYVNARACAAVAAHPAIEQRVDNPEVGSVLGRRMRRREGAPGEDRSPPQRVDGTLSAARTREP